MRKVHIRHKAIRDTRKRRPSSRLGGRALWADCPPAWLKRIGGVLEPNEIGLRLSERRATNIGLLYPKVRNNICGIFPLTSPQPKYWGMCPRHPRLCWRQCPRSRVKGTMGVNSLPKTVTRQRRDCDLNPGPSVPESSTLTTRRLPSYRSRGQPEISFSIR